MTDPRPTGALTDFDFLNGDWTGANRRLKTRWVASDNWDTFPATCRCTVFLGGVANVDEIRFPTRSFSGMTVRLFDRAARRWSIYWANSKAAVLEPPVVGGFTGPRGEFYGDDVDDGTPIQVRFIWTRLDPDHARWEQAFARGPGAWETNWIMEFARAAGGAGRGA